MFADIQLFAALGVGGIMPEGQRGATADLHELRSWVSASLYWDASRDPDALVGAALAAERDWRAAQNGCGPL